MAKLLKHLGFGGKKAPPQPPKPDYSGLKSAGSEYSGARSPTNERQSSTLPAGSSHIGEADSSQGSPHRAASSTEKGTAFGGARPKDTGGGGVSPKGATLERASVPSVSSIDDPEGPSTGEQETQGAVGSGPSATPPRLLDEYSDPIDLKRQILEENMLGACAAPIAEDDYSVPYEVKKLFRDMGLREGMDQNTPVRVRGKNPRLYDDPYDEQGAGGVAPTRGPPAPGENADRRPKEDYDEPWEWSAKQSMLLKTELASGGHNLPPHFMTKQTPQTQTPLVKRTIETKPAAAVGDEDEDEEPDFIETVDTEQEVEADTEAKVVEATTTEVKTVEAKSEVSEPKAEPKAEAKPEADTKTSEAKPDKTEEGKKEEGATGGAEEPDVQIVEEGYKEDYEYNEMTSSYEKTRRRESEEEGEGYTHLTSSEAEAGESTLGQASSIDPEETTTDTMDTAPSESTTTTTTASAATGNYEEPWDLTSKQREIEDKLKAVSDRASRDQNAKIKVPAPHESDTRSQEGYEKPWDWKPHQKDDRSQEGYEKPWDWKPHQRDDRPVEEYEEPWDQKAKGLGRDLLSPKTSNPPSGAGSKNYPRKEEDTRPPEEYDEPWENKMKKSSSSPKAGSSSDSSPKSSQSPGTSSPHHGASSPHHGPSSGLSPKKKQHKLNLDLGASRPWNMVGERIDPTVPLDQQGWYHGSIGREDAEKLLRVHKEGSYLVRMSESSRMDFSLSLKSARGFMHMKIVHRDNKYILGQFSQPFSTIPEMIHHYSISKLPIKGAEHMSLLHPVINELL